MCCYSALNQLVTCIYALPRQGNPVRIRSLFLQITRNIKVFAGHVHKDHPEQDLQER